MNFLFKIFGFFKKFISIFKNFQWESCFSSVRLPVSFSWPYFPNKIHVFSKFNGIFNLFFFNQTVRINNLKKRDGEFSPCPPTIKRSPYTRFSIFYWPCRTTKMFFKKFNWRWICHGNAYIKSITKIMITALGTFGFRNCSGNSNTSLSIEKTGSICCNFFGYQGIYE